MMRASLIVLCFAPYAYSHSLCCKSSKTEVIALPQTSFRVRLEASRVLRQAAPLLCGGAPRSAPSVVHLSPAGDLHADPGRWLLSLRVTENIRQSSLGSPAHLMFNIVSLFIIITLITEFWN